MYSPEISIELITMIFNKKSLTVHFTILILSVKPGQETPFLLLNRKEEIESFIRQDFFVFADATDQNCFDAATSESFIDVELQR